jgi:hypothetical protein
MLQPRSLRAIDLKTGKTAWERPVEGQKVLLPLPKALQRHPIDGPAAMASSTVTAMDHAIFAGPESRGAATSWSTRAHQVLHVTTWA